MMYVCVLLSKAVVVSIVLVFMCLISVSWCLA